MTATAARAATTEHASLSRRTDPEDGAPQAPRLASVSTGALLVAPVRAVVAGAILGGAVSEGLPRGGVLLAVGAGAIVLGLSAANRRPLRFDDVPDAPAGAIYSPWWQSVVRAAVPSTVGLGGLGGIALAFSRGLAGLCGGLLAGLAILGLVFGILLVLEERKERTRLYVTWSVVAPRRYAGR